MKEIKQIIWIIKAPALILHEMLHLFACLLTFTQIFGLEFDFKNCRAHVKYAIPRNKHINFIICAAPLMAFFAALALCAFSFWFSFFLLMYLFMAKEASFLSQQDIRNIKDFSKEESFNWDF